MNESFAGASDNFQNALSKLFDYELFKRNSPRVFVSYFDFSFKLLFSNYKHAN